MPRIALYAARYHDDPYRLYPLGLGYLAAYLVEQAGWPVEDIRLVDSLDELGDFVPDIVGVSSVSQVLTDAGSFAAACRERFGCTTVLGGYHITLAPQTLPAVFDYGVLGEGEISFLELVLALRDGRMPEAAAAMEGICFHGSGGVVVNPPRPLMADLDSFPFPLRQKRYSDESPIFTSRGCPYACIYCAGPVFWRQKYRMRSAGSVVAEIESLLEREHPREIAILDDLWMADKKRFRAIVEALEERGIPGKVTFRGFCRSNLIYEEDILLLKRMNYRFVRFGAETGSEALLKRIKGPSASLVHHQRVVDLCARHGMPCSASFMFGIPGETREDLEQTRAFLTKNRGKLSIAGFYLFNPMPGTPLWVELKGKGALGDQEVCRDMDLNLLRTGFSWERTPYFNEAIIPLAELRGIVQEIRADFIRR